MDAAAAEDGGMGPSPEIQIRRAAPEDAESIAKVLYDSFVGYEPLYTREGFAATTPSAKQVLGRMREGPIWIALHKARPLGTVSAVVKGDSVYLRGMAVLPTARGLGVGRRLLGQVEHWASGEGRSRLFLSTTPFLDSAIRLYEKSGFLRVDDGPHHLFGTPLLTMEKELSQRE